MTRPRDEGASTSNSPLQLSYKPPALKLVCLSIFLASFAACIGLIEWLLSTTVRAENTDSAFVSTTNLPRRELTTITTFDTSLLTCASRSYSAACIDNQAYTSQSLSGEKVYDDLCSAYANTFRPYENAFVPLSLQAPFTSWTSAYSLQQTVQRDVRYASAVCLQDPEEACSAEWWAMYSPSSMKTVTMTVGCLRTTTTMQPPCSGSGGVALQNGSITTTSAAWCGAKEISQLVITTDVVRTTSTSSSAQQAAKVTTPASPSLTTATSRQSPATHPATAAVAGTSTPASSLPIRSSVTSSERIESMTLPTSALPITFSDTESGSIATVPASYTEVPYTTSQAAAITTLHIAITSPTRSASGSTAEITRSGSQETGVVTSSTIPGFSGGDTDDTRNSVSTFGAILSSHTLLTSNDDNTHASETIQPIVTIAFSISSGADTTRTYMITSTLEDSITSRGTITTVNQVLSPSSIAATRTQPTIEGNSTIAYSLAANEVYVNRQFTLLTYFMAMFLPALVAVLIKSMWSIIASSLKMVEPFQRLAGIDGVSAKYSIMTQYLDDIISLDIFRALSHGRTIPIFSAMIYLMVEIAPLIASISMGVKARDMCEVENQWRPCNPAWIINMPLIRLLEVFLVLCVGLVVCLMFITRRSRIPVAANPSSMIALASLLNYAPLISELQSIDPDADSRTFGAALQHRSFRLAKHHNLKSEKARFGFVSNHADRYQDEPTRSLFSRDQASTETKYAPIDELAGSANSTRNLSRNFHRKLFFRSWTMVLLHLLTSVGLMVLIMYYWLDTNLDSAFNRFINGDSVPQYVSKTIFVGVAILVDIQTKNLERIIRITDPYRRLSLRNARAETTILLPLNGTCWSNLPKNLYLLCHYEFAQGRMAWATFVGVVACLGDANIIAVAGLIWTTSQTRESYHVCGYLSMACTSAILLVVLITIFWWLNVPAIRRIPRQPDNICNILSYLCGSEMIKEWNDLSDSGVPLERMDRGARDEFVTNSRRYCFGRMLGVDDRERWCIDYERDQSQVMIVGQNNTGSIAPLPAVPLHWRATPAQVSKRGLAVRTRYTRPELEPLRTQGTQSAEYSLKGERHTRFPSLRLVSDHD